jgi:hypothetical protein
MYLPAFDTRQDNTGDDRAGAPWPVLIAALTCPLLTIALVIAGLVR